MVLPFITRLSQIFTLFVLVFVVSSPVLGATGNEDLKKNVCGGANLSLSEGGSQADGLNRSCSNPVGGDGNPQKGLNDVIATVVNLLSIIVGVVAIIMIIIGGLKYVTSAGDPAKIGSAKNTVIYALVGLVIVALAQTIVRYVIKLTD